MVSYTPKQGYGMNPIAQYFALHEQIQLAKRRHNYSLAAACTKAVAPLFAPLVAGTIREFGQWDIHSSVAVTEGAPVLMALGDHEGLQAMYLALTKVPQLAEWAEEVADRVAMANIGDRLVDLLKEGPTSQAAAMSALGASDGRKFSNLCSWLAKVGRIDRVKQGKSFQLAQASA